MCLPHLQVAMEIGEEGGDGEEGEESEGATSVCAVSVICAGGEVGEEGRSGRGGVKVKQLVMLQQGNQLRGVSLLWSGGQRVLGGRGRSQHGVDEDK